MYRCSIHATIQHPSFLQPCPGPVTGLPSQHHHTSYSGRPLQIPLLLPTTSGCSSMPGDIQGFPGHQRGVLPPAKRREVSDTLTVPHHARMNTSTFPSPGVLSWSVEKFLPYFSTIVSQGRMERSVDLTALRHWRRSVQQQAAASMPYSTPV